MGQTIEVKFDVNQEKIIQFIKILKIFIHFQETGHRGITRFRLCKLSKSTDVVNQACLDQNLLEITQVTSIDMKLADKYTLTKMHTTQNVTVQ